MLAEQVKICRQPGTPGSLAPNRKAVLTATPKYNWLKNSDLKILIRTLLLILLSKCLPGKRPRDSQAYYHTAT